VLVPLRTHAYPHQPPPLPLTRQYSDEMTPYLNLTKALYKDLVTVQKTSAGALQVASVAIEVTEVSGAALFPRQSPHNFCYITIDPAGRQVKCWYAAWFPMM